MFGVHRPFTFRYRVAANGEWREQMSHDKNGRTPRRSVCNSALAVCVLSICAMLIVAGCNDGSNTDDSRAGNQPETFRSEPIWESWQKPQLALMLTTEMHGYFEPCGCTSNQLGGMSRRADLLAKMTDAGWIVRGLDVGGLARRSVLQAQIKFETTLAALRALSYVAIGIGPEELRLDPDFLLSQHIIEDESSLAFLSANLVFYDAPDIGTPQQSKIVEAGNIKLGVTSVLSKQLKTEVLPHPVVSWKEPADVLPRILEGFREQGVNLRVLLSQGTPEEAEEYARQFPEFDVILTAEGIGDPNPGDPPKKVGNTLIISAGRKGKYVGVLGVYPEEAEQRFRYQLVSLEEKDFDDAQAMVDLMQSYQTRLKDEEVVLKDGISSPHPSGSTFVGADACGECHTKAFAKWKETPHAHALESLDPTHKHKGFERLHGVNRTYDPECLACHVAGWDPTEYIRYKSGFLNREFAQTDEEKTLHKMLAGTQCENCHGPGSRHIALIEAGESEAARELVRVTKAQAEKGLCERCHDSDNSPKFEFDKYWKLVEHPGLD